MHVDCDVLYKQITYLKRSIEKDQHIFYRYCIKINVIQKFWQIISQRNNQSECGWHCMTDGKLVAWPKTWHWPWMTLLIKPIDLPGVKIVQIKISQKWGGCRKSPGGKLLWLVFLSYGCPILTLTWRLIASKCSAIWWVCQISGYLMETVPLPVLLWYPFFLDCCQIQYCYAC